MNWWVDGFYLRAEWYLSMETAILNNVPANITPSHSTKRSLSDRHVYRRSTNENDTVDVEPFGPMTSLGAPDPLAAVENPFVFPAVSCLDMSFEGISDLDSFVDYISGQFAVNPLAAYPGVQYAQCLSWPNLTSYDVERYIGPFPLIIGTTNDPTTPFTGVISTYEYVGSDNAALLIHDAFGHSTVWGLNMNNCTLAAMRAYLINGKSFTKIH